MHLLKQTNNCVSAAGIKEWINQTNPQSQVFGELNPKIKL